MREVGNVAASGFSSANTLARFYSILVTGGAHKGKTLLTGWSHVGLTAIAMIVPSCVVIILCFGSRLQSLRYSYRMCRMLCRVVSAWFLQIHNV